LMIINKSGVTIRVKMSDINIIGRATQGVRLINLDKRNDEIASVCKVISESDMKKIEEGNLIKDVFEENNPENDWDVDDISE